MPSYTKILLEYLLTINIIGFAVMGYDKTKARRGDRRVPEKHLFAAAALGGALGVLAAMKKFRHKTKHPSFRFGIPALLAVNLACVFFIIKAFMEVGL